MINKLERIFGRLAVPHLTLVMTVGLTLSFGASLLWPDTVTSLWLSRELVLGGEWWRLVTFMFVAPGWHPLFAAFALYMFYLMGNALEGEWGEFRFNLFILVGYVATLLAAWIAPWGVASNAFILGSVFLAFAYLYPDFVIYVFFILPVKIKWLALITWLGYGWTLIMGEWMERFLVVAAVGNFLLFFGKDIALRAKSARRRMERQTKIIAAGEPTFHRCAVCGATEKSHPDAEFRVCEDCASGHEYCAAHLHEHKHT